MVSVFQEEDGDVEGNFDTFLEMQVLCYGRAMLIVCFLPPVSEITFICSPTVCLPALSSMVLSSTSDTNIPYLVLLVKGIHSLFVSYIKY